MTAPTNPVSADGKALREAVETLQARVKPWMSACFGEVISADRLERSDRFIEEAIELLQAGGYPRERILSLVDYVYGRAPGDAAQEVGGVMITLAAFCLAHGLDMHAAGETELARIWTKVEAIRAKQAAKPTGSALPIAVAPVTDRLSELEAEVARVTKERDEARADARREYENVCTQQRHLDAATAERDTLAQQVKGLREALTEAIDVFDGMMDDEISADLLPRLRERLAAVKADKERG